MYVRWAFGTSNTGRITVGDRLNEVTVDWGSTVQTLSKNKPFLLKLIQFSLSAEGMLLSINFSFTFTQTCMFLAREIQQWLLIASGKRRTN